MFIEHSPFNHWSGQYDSFNLAVYSEFAMFGLLNPGVQGAQDDAYRRVCGEPAMSPHRLFRSPTAGAALLRSSRPLLHHRRHRCGLFVARLEDRTLLSGPSGDVLAAVASKIELGTPKTGTLAPGEVAFFQIDPTTDGRLVAQVHAEGPPRGSRCWTPTARYSYRATASCPATATIRSISMSRRGPPRPSAFYSARCHPDRSGADRAPPSTEKHRAARYRDVRGRFGK